MKKIFTIILSFLLLVTPVFALPDGSNRNDLENYGVKKKWNINSSNLNNVLKTPYVDASKKIYDYSDILTEEEEKELFNKIGQFIEHTHMDMVILTIDYPYIDDSANETYASDFYDYNDFGLDFEHYDGVLLLRNTYSSDPYFNVYTFGEAQLYFDYDRCESMLDDIYPYFRSKDYLRGMNLFISDFTNYYDSGKALEDYYVDDMGYIQRDPGSFKIPFIPALGGGAIVALITILVLVKKNKMVKKSTEANDYLAKGSVVYNTRSDILTGSFTTHHRIQRDSGGSGGGFSSHSGSSGGGHGGGGGRHG